MVLAVIALTGPVLTCSCVSIQRCLKKNNSLVVFLCKGVKKQVLSLCLYLKVFKEKQHSFVFFLFTHTKNNKHPLKNTYACWLKNTPNFVVFYPNNNTLMWGVYRGHQPKVQGGLKMYELCYWYLSFGVTSIGATLLSSMHVVKAMWAELTHMRGASAGACHTAQQCLLGRSWFKWCAWCICGHADLRGMHTHPWPGLFNTNSTPLSFMCSVLHWIRKQHE